MPDDYLTIEVLPNDPGAMANACGQVRERRRDGELPAAGARILLRGGRHFLAAPIRFGPEDAGTAEAPLVIAAHLGEEPRLVGGVAVSPTDLPPVTDPALLARLPAAAREQVRELRLADWGISEPGPWLPRGHGGGSAAAAVELFWDGQALPVARWPKAARFANHGFARIAETRGERIVYDDGRPGQWDGEDDLYVHGYFSLDWASTIARVTRHDQGRREIATDPAGCGHYGIKAGGRFFWFNVLAELSAPGDWFLGRAANRILLWPPAADGELLVSTLAEPMLQLHETRHVKLEGLTLEGTRGDGIEIVGGSDNQVRACVLHNVGRHGIVIRDGLRHSVVDCDISATGESGIEIEAGDRQALTAARHLVENCHVHHIAREAWTYFPAVRVHGCGTSIRHSRLHDHRHALILFHGNDHCFEGNELYNYGLEADDAGAIYAGRDFSVQGNVIRGNYIHHGGDSGRNEWGVAGVYLDDCCGGAEISDNVFQLANKAVLAGGGVNTHIHDNLFVDCHPAVWFDERGASSRPGQDGMIHDFMRRRFYEVKAHQPPYAERYPHLDRVHQSFTDGVGILAWGGVVRDNATVNCGRWLNTHWAVFPEYFDCRDNRQVDDDEHHWGDISASVEGWRESASWVATGEVGLRRTCGRPRLCDLWTRLEVVAGIGADGRPGKARLHVRNAGDFPARGVELIEVKLQRHGPGVAVVEVPFELAAGAEESSDFEVPRPDETPAGCGELFLFTRGEELRPAWTPVGLDYAVATKLKVTAAPSSDGDPGEIALRLILAGDQALTPRVELSVEPPGVQLTEGRLEPALAPGEPRQHRLALQLDPDAERAVSVFSVHCRGQGVQPATTTGQVRYMLPDLGPLDELAPDLLAAQPILPLAWLAPHPHAPGERLADVRLAFAGSALLLCARVFDPQVRTGELLWDGSCLEVFGCSPDRQRIGHVFGQLPIGQVYLLPACDGQAAAAYQQIDNRHRPLPEARLETQATEDGYQLQALLPLGLLGVDAGAAELLFELQLTLGPAPKTGCRRATLFGSATPFNDVARYGRAHRAP